MKTTLMTLWHDDRGFLISAELVVVGTLLVLGLVVGLTSVQNALVSELSDVGQAIGSLDQTYYYKGFASESAIDCHLKAYSTGSAFFDTRDDCDEGVQALMCDEVPHIESEHRHHHHHKAEPRHRHHDRAPEGHKREMKHRKSRDREGSRRSSHARIETTQVATAE
ncbi:hypothetical protein [Thalassoroseus pseudoceratinae]|uniref:hypothetical protein n=1 Tax=Thalassoroseus pseudoceratinae TaxID=2713176 RepID=UPI00197D5A49|nr:hypothetical protein [Thalassoroseus pseudoceratinae]